MFNEIIMMTSKLLVTHKKLNHPKSRWIPSITFSVYLVHRREKMAQVLEYLIYFKYLTVLQVQPLHSVVSPSRHRYLVHEMSTPLQEKLCQVYSEGKDII